MSKEKFVRDKPHVNFGVLVLLLVASGGLMAAVSVFYLPNPLLSPSPTRDVDVDGVPDIVEDGGLRRVQANVSGSSLSITKIRANGVSPDVVTFSIQDVPGSLNIATEYAPDAATTATAIEHALTYNAILEYNDGNSNGMYDPASESPVQNYTIPALTFLSFGREGDQRLHVARYASTDGSFHATFHTREDYGTLGGGAGGILSPHGLKTTIRLESFSPAGPSTRLALHVILTSPASVSDISTTSEEAAGRASDEMGIRASPSASVSFEFTWPNKATVNSSVTVPVVPTPVQQDPLISSRFHVYLSIPHAVKFELDPITIPVLDDRTYQDLQSGDPDRPVIIGLAAAAGSLGGIAITEAVMKARGARITFGDGKRGRIPSG
ncbi:MAG: hypothetical protein JW839_15745 [Candidatus Lokiarchaeota archaeon]|nr:hypothetical protein [Candidatus Lokiarchaeota archaeon]